MTNKSISSDENCPCIACPEYGECFGAAALDEPRPDRRCAKGKVDWVKGDTAHVLWAEPGPTETVYNATDYPEIANWKAGDEVCEPKRATPLFFSSGDLDDFPVTPQADLYSERRARQQLGSNE